MDLIDVKRTKEDKKAESERWENPDARDDYPWGLSISVNEETMEKLGLTDKDFDAGQPVMIHAEGFISEDRVNVFNGKKQRSMSIQFKKMAVEQDGEKSETISAAMYGA